MPARGGIGNSIQTISTVNRVYQSGYFYGPGQPHTLSTIANGTNLLTLMPFWVGAPFACDRLGVEATATAATAVARLGIWLPDANDVPATLAAAISPVTVDVSSASGSNGVLGTISYQFQPGLYYLGAVCQTASGTLRSIAATTQLQPVSSNSGSTPFGSTALSCYYKTGISGALADVSGLSIGGGAYLVKARAA